jgi:hypothetical protein
MIMMRLAQRRWLRRHWSSTVLIPLGLILILVAMYQAKGREFASTALVTGSVLVLVGALHHKIVRAKLPGGAEVELKQEARHVTSRIAVQSEPLAPETIGPDEEDDATRWVLATRLFDDLLIEPTDALAGCAMQLYLYDEEWDLLLPILTPGHRGPSPGFAPGQGATGMAWDTGEYVVAEGRAVADDTFHLSPEQQERYRDLAVVAAMPVTNAAGRVIAVLSAASRDPKSGLLTDAGFEGHVFLAGAVARILVDLLKWFDDTYDESS